jgi:Spy/CpxP family protein refolding chaperone
MALNLHRSFFMVVLAAAALPVMAQSSDSAPPPPAADGQDQAPPPPRRSRAEHRLKELKAKLGLTDAQVQQIKDIFKTQMQQGRALREDDSLSDDDRRAKMMALMKSAHDQVRAILTPAQQQIFDTMPPAGMGPRGRGPGGPPPPPAEGDAPPAPPPTT